jgi:hypothetical protein
MPDSPLGWDEALPADAGLVSLGPIQVRETKLQFSSRMEKEHAVIAASGVGGEHKAGSAFAFYQDETPVLRPDEVTNLDVNDNGRLWINSTNNLLYFWATTIPVRVRTDTYAKLTYTNVVTNPQSGGAAVATTWTIRPLNTEDSDEYDIVTLAANKFTLAAGTYRIRIRGAFSSVDGCQNRLYNYTGAAAVLNGDVAYSSSTITNNGNAAFGNVYSEIVGQFTLTIESELGVEYWAETAKGGANGGGLGWGGNTTGYNIFLTVEIQKVADA